MANEYGSGGDLSVKLAGPFSSSGGGGVRFTSVTLPAVNWKGGESPYFQTVSVAYVAASSIVNLHPTAEQVEKLNAIFLAENDSGVVTVYAVGEVPAEDITLLASVTDSFNAGVTRGTPAGRHLVRANFNQTDPTMPDYIENNPFVQDGEVALRSSPYYDLDISGLVEINAEPLEVDLASIVSATMLREMVDAGYIIRLKIRWSFWNEESEYATLPLTEVYLFDSRAKDFTILQTVFADPYFGGKYSCLRIWLCSDGTCILNYDPNIGETTSEGANDKEKCIEIALPNALDFTSDLKDTDITEQVAAFADTLMDDAESGVPVYLTGVETTGMIYRIALDQVYNSSGVGLLLGTLTNPRDRTKVACFIVSVISADYVGLEYHASIGTDNSLAEVREKTGVDEWENESSMAKILTAMTMGNTCVDIVRSGQIITITETLEDGNGYVTVINLNENDWPVSITVNGTTVPVTWSGFDG